MTSSLTPRQREILEASLSIIDTEGIKRFTMKNVAQRIGVTDAALYKHFPDKGAILVALQTLFKNATLEILTALQADPGRDALGKLEVFVKGRARQFQDNRAMTVTLFSEELFRGLDSSSMSHDTMESHADLLMGIIREGQAAGTLRADVPPVHMVMLLTGPMRLMVASWKADPSGRPSLVERVDLFWTTFASLVRGPHA